MAEGKKTHEREGLQEVAPLETRVGLMARVAMPGYLEWRKAREEKRAARPAAAPA